MKFPERELMRERARTMLRALLAHMGDAAIGAIADWLLREGALFPPVRVGQWVYIAFDEEDGGIDTWQVHGLKYDRGEWLVLDHRGDESRIGEWDCLLTREEAERVLAERNGREKK